MLTGRFLSRLAPPVALLAALVIVPLSFAPPLPKGKENPKSPETEEAKPADDTVRNRLLSENNLKKFGLALHNYLDAYDKFPADITDKGGKVLLSWRVQLLPFLDLENLYKEFKLNEPWDSKHNIKLLARMPKVFDSPRVTLKNKGYTVYQGFSGAGAFFHSGKAGRRIVTITDGTSNTIAVVEATAAVPWTKPADIPFDAKKDVVKFGKAFGERPIVLMVDGSTRMIDLKKLSKETLKAAITTQGGEVLGGDWE